MQSGEFLLFFHHSIHVRNGFNRDHLPGADGLADGFHRAPLPLQIALFVGNAPLLLF